jgi:hypothetical protein
LSEGKKKEKEIKEAGPNPLSQPGPLPFPLLTPAWATRGPAPSPLPLPPRGPHPGPVPPSLPCLSLLSSHCHLGPRVGASPLLSQNASPFFLSPSDQRSPPVRLFFSLASLPCSLPRSLPADPAHPSLGVAPPRCPLDPLLRTAPRLDASGSYPSSDEAQAATARGMRGTRWIGGPHAEAAGPSLFLSVAPSGRPKP